MTKSDLVPGNAYLSPQNITCLSCKEGNFLLISLTFIIVCEEISKIPLKFVEFYIIGGEDSATDEFPHMVTFIFLITLVIENTLLKSTHSIYL